MTPRRAASALITIVLLAGLRHILTNRAAPTWDDAWYLEVAFRLHHALGRGLADFASEWASAFKIKAPLVSLLPLPLFAVFEPSERLAAAASLLMHGLACLFTGAAALSLWREHPRREALASLAASLVALTPLLYGLSRVFMAESLVTALVSAAAWRLAAVRHEPQEGRALGALLGLGLLAKITFPLFLMPLIWLRRRSLAAHFKAVALVGGALAATWYAFNLPYVLGFAWSAGFGRIGADYAAHSRLAFPARLCAGALSWPFAAALAAVLCAASVARGRELLDDGTRFALAWLAPLAVFALGVNAEPRLTAPALPALALLGARAALSFDTRAGRAAAITLLLAAGGGVFARETFVALPGEHLPWSGAPETRTPWDRGALVDAAVETSGEDGVAALAFEDRRLNANNLSALAAARGLELRFVSLGYAQDSVEAALLRIKDKGASSLIFVDGVPEGKSPTFLNLANSGVAAAVADGRLAAALTGRVSLAAGVTARVYRLTPSM